MIDHTVANGASITHAAALKERAESSA